MYGGMHTHVEVRGRGVTWGSISSSQRGKHAPLPAEPSHLPLKNMFLEIMPHFITQAITELSM